MTAQEYPVVFADFPEDSIQWVRFPGLAERQEVEPGFEGMEEWCYQLLYGCHLCLAIAKLQEAFLNEHADLAEQNITLARVPRGGVLATEILEQLLEEHQPEMLSLDREQIREVRKAYKQLNADPESAVAKQVYLDSLSALLPSSETLTADPSHDYHLVLPEDIADSGNTLLLIIEAYTRNLLKKGVSSAHVSILVPTASEQSLSPQQGIVARARELAQQLSVEYRRPFELDVKIFTLYEESDPQYLAALRQDRHDHGTTHELVRTNPAFAEMKRVLFEQLRGIPELSGHHAGTLLTALTNSLTTLVS